MLRLLVVLALVSPVAACEEEAEDADDGMADTGESSRIDPARLDAILDLPGDATRGEMVFPTCRAASCHGADGDSGDGARLSEVVPSLPDRELVDIVLGGEGRMLPNDLQDQAMADLLAYLRATFG